MSRVFRSALFPLIVIAALVWLALHTLGNHGAKQVKTTYSDLVTQVQTQPQTIEGVTFVPSKHRCRVQRA